MDEDVHTLLSAVDEPGQWEFPRKTSMQTSWEELSDLLPKLKALTNLPLDFDSGQDASFTAELILKNFTNHNWQTIRLGILSNFGRLFTLSVPVCLKVNFPIDVSVIKEFFEQQGFIFVPYEELNYTYDGVNADPKYPMSWFVRYFDYL